MRRWLAAWLPYKWRHDTPPKEIRRAIQATFSTHEGRVVLQWLLDRVYCTVSVSQEAIELASHNGRRSVVQELLEVLDEAQHPQKYGLQTEAKEDTWQTAPTV